MALLARWKRKGGNEATLMQKVNKQPMDVCV